MQRQTCVWHRLLRVKCDKTENHSLPVVPEEWQTTSLPLTLRSLPCLVFPLVYNIREQRGWQTAAFSAVYWCSATAFQWPLCLAAGAFGVSTQGQLSVMFVIINEGGVSSKENIVKPGWKVSHVCRIYFTCPTGKEPKENIWKEGDPSKAAWKVIR